MGYRTIKENERVLIFNRQGSAREVIGPRRLWLSRRERLEYMPRHVVSQDQYIVVQYRDGRKEHIRGPCELFMNRLELDSAYVKDATKMDENHMVVVYKQWEGKIERRIVPGPTLFIPTAEEWLHEFQWHGHDRNNPGRYIPGKNRFIQLRHVPSHLYCNVRDVRTNDISIITVKLMIFFQLADVERMLTYTHDPIADFINAVQADVIAFASQKSYAEFIRHTDDMNSMDCYKQLMSRAQHIGYHITKVVYRGYEATRALQATHDDAVRNRMKLKLDAESEEQEQTIMKFKLQREKERTKLKHEMETRVQEHTQKLEKMDTSITLDRNRLVLEATLKKEEKEVLQDAEMDNLENQQKAHFLGELRGLQVDATRYLIAKQPQFHAQKEIIISPARALVN